MSAILLAWCAGPLPAEAQRVWGPDAVPLAHYAAPLADWPAPSYRAKDFTLVKVGPIYHLFYTRWQRYVPRHAGLGPTEVLNETALGHAVSRDLEHWGELDTVLSIDATSYERHHVWAPSIVQKDGVWWMFYTGVTDAIQSGTTSSWIPKYQFICAAYSTDVRLRKWTRLPGPVWQPCAGNGLPGVSWALCNPTLTGGCADFRDGFVLPPPAGSPVSSPWLMYYTARPRTDQYNFVVGVAQTALGPGSAWSDGGALWDLYAPQSNSKLESPHVFRHGDTWNLFVTGDDGTNGILRYTALWPATGPWEGAGSLIPRFTGLPDPPYAFTLDPSYWFASEYYGEDGPVDHADYFCFVHTYDVPSSLNPPGTPQNQVEPVTDIEFRRMLWNADGSFDLTTPNPVRSMTLSQTQATVGDTVTVLLSVNGGSRQRADFSVVVTGPTGETPVAAASVGLPASVPLVDGVLAVRWPVQVTGVALPANLVVRMGNQPLLLDAPITLQAAPGGAESILPTMPIVRVRPPGSSGAAGRPGGTGPVALELRQVGAVPGRGGIGLLVGLPEPGPARLDIYDVLGRHVRSLAGGDLPRGYTLEAWDGNDAQGRMVRRGIYFAQLTSGGRRVSARLLLIDG